MDLFRGLGDLMYLREAKTKRISSWDRTGRNRDFFPLARGQTATIAEIQGAGVIRHIWITIDSRDELYPRKILLRMYWDGEAEPSVEVPVGDFFGVGHAVIVPYMAWALNIVGNRELRPNRGAMNSFFPMPFEKGARLEVVNECDGDARAFYYYIDYEELPALPEGVARFHAQWRRENPCPGLDTSGMTREEVADIVNLSGRRNYPILEAEGRGHYVGCNLSVHNLEPEGATHWFGEGDDMIFVDGEVWPPSLHGTGTEDYFGAAWGFPSGAYSGPFHGISLAGDTANWGGKWTVYRHHILDPIHFSRSIRVTIEHGGHDNERADDYSSTAYWYQTEPHKAFPKMPPVLERLPRP